VQCQTAALFLRTAVAGVRRRKSLLAELGCVPQGRCGRFGDLPSGGTRRFVLERVELQVL
jgi:hypothetical protein